MGWLDTGLTGQELLAALAITSFAGFVKGAIGFAMPMIMIGLFSAFLAPEQALAGLILPTLVSNINQAFRQGVPAALETARIYRRFLIATLVFLVLSSRFAGVIPTPVFLILLGLPITAFAALQLSGRPLAMRLEHRVAAEWGLGVIGGLYGGVSGIWGPPLLVFLLSTGADRDQMIRAQGVVFLLGAVVLTGAHLATGVLAGPNLVFSAVLVVPALIGQRIGVMVLNRLDANRFRRWTQILLVVTGANLLRQGFMALI